MSGSQERGAQGQEQKMRSCAACNYRSHFGQPFLVGCPTDSNGCRLRSGRFFCMWSRVLRPWCPRLPETSLLVVGGAMIRFAVPGPALCAWAPQLPRITLGTALQALADHGCRKWLTSIIPMLVGCTGVTFSAPGRAPSALSAPSCLEMCQRLQAV